jgi:hypothetical protein
MAAGRTRAILGYGWAHFGVYAVAVLLATPLGLAGVAAAASAVHLVFLYVAYALMLRGSQEHAIPRLWGDLKPAIVSCLGLALLAVPVDAWLVASDAPAVAVILATTVAGVCGYALALRVVFPAAWRTVAEVVGQVVPLHRLGRPRGTRSALQPEGGA